MHYPVMLEEVLVLLDPPKGGTVVDGTLGGGGHACALLEKTVDGRLLGLDRDPQAIEAGRETLKSFGSRVVLECGSFSEVLEIANSHGIDRVDAIVMDLGISSNQLDNADRGFSFMRQGPLDMRMDGSQGETAADILNHYPEEEIANILYQYGDERLSRRIARAVVGARKIEPITTTTEFAGLVVKAKGGGRGKIHPATQSFQALRIAVNDELGSLKSGLDGAMSLLAQGGRLGVISFHSLEDRMVKKTFRAHTERFISLPAGGADRECEEPEMKMITRKPVCATKAEVEENARSRSAKLRVVERKG